MVFKYACCLTQVLPTFFWLVNGGVGWCREVGCQCLHLVGSFGDERCCCCCRCCDGRGWKKTRRKRIQSGATVWSSASVWTSKLTLCLKVCKTQPNYQKTEVNILEWNGIIFPDENFQGQKVTPFLFPGGWWNFRKKALLVISRILLSVKGRFIYRKYFVCFSNHNLKATQFF